MGQKTLSVAERAHAYIVDSGLEGLFREIRNASRSLYKKDSEPDWITGNMAKMDNNTAECWFYQKHNAANIAPDDPIWKHVPYGLNSVPEKIRAAFTEKYNFVISTSKWLPKLPVVQNTKSDIVCVPRS